MQKALLFLAAAGFVGALIWWLLPSSPTDATETVTTQTAPAVRLREEPPLPPVQPPDSPGDTTFCGQIFHGEDRYLLRLP
ncbi:MAG: hypothetical protein JJT96_16170 [Opitutales bacterium]|nr:hypothetical protein [Opitutales bacterium]